MKILFVGDIVGKIGRKTIAKLIPKLRKKYKLDLVIANAENIAHGNGVTKKTLKEILKAGVDYCTSGDHAFDRLSELNCYDEMPIIRPANYADNIPGKGYAIIKIKNKKVLLINLIGRVFMKMQYNCPFKEVEKILNLFKKDKFNAIIVDIHAEASSEKIALKYFLENKVSALVGTHTHIMTADNQVSKKGLAYITDIGMVGYRDGSLGINKTNLIKTFLTQIKYPHTIRKKGRAIFNGVMIDINQKNKKAKSIKKIIEFLEIK